MRSTWQLDTNGWELAVTITSLLGILVQTYLINKVRLSFTALQGIRSMDARRLVAQDRLAVGIILIFCHTVFLYWGVRLSFAVDPPAYPTEFVINVVMFIGVTAGLLIIGLSDFRLHRLLRN